MATSYVHPVVRFQANRVKFRPKLVVAPKAGRREGDHEPSAGRTTGVGISAGPAGESGGLPPRAVVEEAIDTALDSVGILERQARDVARRFRRQAALAQANLGLSYLVQSTQTLLRLAEMTARASGQSLEELCEVHGITAPVDTSAAVAGLIREQLAEDWTAVASVLEQRFLSALAGWRRVFEALGGTSPDPYGSAA